MLAKDFAVLSARLDRHEAAFSIYVASASGRGAKRERDWHALEGLLSATWQTWCGFCRSVTLRSCIGTTSRSGTVTNSIPDVTDVGRLAYLAKSISLNQTIKPGKSLAPHQEPTWGDLSLILDTVRYLKPDNLSALEVGLLSSSRAPLDMRTVRNAAAHVSSSTLRAVERIKIFYAGVSYAHPVDILSWKDRSTNDFVYNAWVSDLRGIADDMTT